MISIIGPMKFDMPAMSAAASIPVSGGSISDSAEMSSPSISSSWVRMSRPSESDSFSNSGR